MANLRRRSARLSKTATSQSPARKTPVHNIALESLVERDETPDNVQPSIDRILATPSTSRATGARLYELEILKTPQTEPKADQADLNPKTAHRSTTKAPDSGLKFGFSDIRKDKTYDTPSKSSPRRNVPASHPFEFQFSAESHLSKDAQKLMDNVREDAARIKTQMLAEKAAQAQSHHDAEKMFGADRKFAQPKGKVGRFSDVHMAQFKKMDSIENHASAFRAKAGLAAPTQQSLKRSPSKAGLDELERPRSVGKTVTTQPKRITPPVTGRPNSVSPFKSIPLSKLQNTAGPAKRARQSELHDVSDSRPISTTPRTRPPSLCSPTKSSIARRSTASQKSSMLPCSNSVKPIRAAKESNDVTAKDYSSKAGNPFSPAGTSTSKAESSLYPTLPCSPSRDASMDRLKSRIPTLSGLKSILRGSHKTSVPVSCPQTPKHTKGFDQSNMNTKKVDFTPSVKSRHAIKLAVDQPSPAQVRRDTPYRVSEPVIPYESSAYTIADDLEDEEENEIHYPSLPSGSDFDSFASASTAQSKSLSRRESKEFKSIFTNLHPSKAQQADALTSINTAVNRTKPEYHTSNVTTCSSQSMLKSPSSTIRHVLPSDGATSDQAPGGRASIVPPGPYVKKRGLDLVHVNNEEDAKENRQSPSTIVIPGGWHDSTVDEAADEGASRAGKRLRISTVEARVPSSSSAAKKPNVAREMAAKNAKERKGRGVLSLARLNMLSRPKTRR